MGCCVYRGNFHSESRGLNKRTKFQYASIHHSILANRQPFHAARPAIITNSPQPTIPPTNHTNTSQPPIPWLTQTAFNAYLDEWAEDLKNNPDTTLTRRRTFIPIPQCNTSISFDYDQIENIISTDPKDTDEW
ncbi:hypothetical protein HDV00_009737 [Rhizophlyctis rosea]|nr:hypothetical protein HDV00_009737 [Rhizophlyctis rosea]